MREELFLAGHGISRGRFVDGIVEGCFRPIVAGQGGCKSGVVVVVGMAAFMGRKVRHLVSGAHVVCRRRSKATQSSGFVGRVKRFQRFRLLEEGWYLPAPAAG